MSILRRSAAVLMTAAVICSSAGSITASASPSPADERIPVSINAPTFRKLSNKKIRIYWSGAKDDRVSMYLVQRYDNTAGKWKTVGKIASDGDRSNGKNYFTDILKTTKRQRYSYRIKVRVSDTEKYKPVTGKNIFASNVKVCVDPGHFKRQNPGTFGYTEAEGVLMTGLFLRDYLKAVGIDVYMTRDDENIYVGGETNTDSGNQLYARGANAGKKKCDLFISLHTNANSAGANGYDTLYQPMNINKTIVFINRTAYNEKTKKNRRLANYIGKYLTLTNKAHGVYSCGWKTGITPKVYVDDDEFTDYNQGLDRKGMLVYRKWGSGDYYAVLRGAADYGVPGMLVEHAFHTYPGFCETFMNDAELASDYAQVETEAMLKYLF